MLKDKIGKNCLLWKTHPLTNTHAGGTRSLYGLFIDLPVAIDKVESWTRAVWVVVVLVFAQCLDDSGSRPVGRRGAKGMRDEGTSLLQLQDNQLLSLPAEHAWYGRFVPSSSLLSSSSSFFSSSPPRVERGWLQSCGTCSALREGTCWYFVIYRHGSLSYRPS